MTQITKILFITGVTAIALTAFIILPVAPSENGVLTINTAVAFDGGGSSGSGGGGEGSGGGFGGDSGCCGAGGSTGAGGQSDGGGGGFYTPPPVVLVPAVCNYLNANTTSVPHSGGNVTLSWSTTNATSVSLSGTGSVAASGSKTVFVNANTTFTLTATGTGGNASCTVSITKQATPAATCDSFTASRNTVPHTGANVVLTWATTNASSVSINNGVGTVSADGNKTVFVNANTTFTLTATGTGGNDTCTVTITKTPPQTTAATCDSFTADRTTVPHNGANVVLTWTTTNATSVSIDNGVGTVSADGSKNVFVNSNTTFTLTAVGTGGNDTCTVSITKTNVEAPSCNYLRIDGNDNDIEEGDDVTLEWSTTNATDVSISPNIGSVSANGSRTVEVEDDITYTLRARNTAGNESTCTLRINVDEEEKEDKKKTPKCELEISEDRVNRGEKVTLSWETTNVDEIVIKDDRGNTIFDTDDYSSSQRKKYFDGEIDVIINQSTEFRMTAEGEDGGDRTCKVDVEVDDIAVYEKRDQALVIALTQVPYTGFEAGAFLTFLFYAVLTLWALFIAYILVVKKGSVLGFSLYGRAAGMSETDVENRKKVEALVAKYADQSWK